MLRSSGVSAAVQSSLQRLERAADAREPAAQRALQLLTYTHTVLQTTWLNTTALPFCKHLSVLTWWRLSELSVHKKTRWKCVHFMLAHPQPKSTRLDVDSIQRRRSAITAPTYHGWFMLHRAASELRCIIRIHFC